FSLTRWLGWRECARDRKPRGLRIIFFARLRKCEEMRSHVRRKPTSRCVARCRTPLDPRRPAKAARRSQMPAEDLPSMPRGFPNFAIPAALAAVARARRDGRGRPGGALVFP